MSGGMAQTIRSDPLELWQGLVLQDMGEVDFHAFWKYWKLASSPNTSKLDLGPSDWSSDFVFAGVPSQELFTPKMTPRKKKLENTKPQKSSFF